MSDDDKRSYMFEVKASNKPEAQDHYANLTIHVVSDTFEHAVETFKGSYPDAKLHKVERRNFMGRSDVLLDPRVINAGSNTWSQKEASDTPHSP